MPRKIACQCGRVLLIFESRAAQRIHCPKCGREFSLREAPESGSAGAVAPPPVQTVRRAPVQTVRRAAGAPLSEPLSEPPEAPPRIVPVPVRTRESVLPARDGAAQRAANAPPALRGMQHSATRVNAARMMALAVVLLAIFAAVPVVFEIRYGWQQEVPLARWAWLVLAFSGLQLAYATYLLQLADWSSTWVTAICLLLLATCYAVLAGVTLTGGYTHALVQFLELADKLPRRQAPLWCLVMVCLHGLLAYFAGRTALRWQTTAAVGHTASAG